MQAIFSNIEITNNIIVSNMKYPRSDLCALLDISAWVMTSFSDAEVAWIFCNLHVLFKYF